MPKTVDFPELGPVDFPDEMSWDQVQQTITENHRSIHEGLFNRRAQQMAAETNAESEPPGIADKYVQAIRSIGKGAVSGVAGLSKAIGEGAAFVNRQVYNGGEPGTVRSGNPEDLTTYKLGKALQDSAEEASPDIPGLEDSFLFRDVPSGIGQVGGAIVTGGGAKALVQGGLSRLGVEGAAKIGTQVAIRGGLTQMAGSEFDDAYQRSIDRGDSPDLATGKAAAYAVLSTAIEAKLGLGRIAKRFGLDDPIKDVQRLATQKLAKTILADTAAGFTEEALQRVAQDYIVDGELDINGVVREGGAGAVVQALLGALGHSGRRHAAKGALQWISQAQQSGVTQAQADEAGFEAHTLEQLGIPLLGEAGAGGLDTSAGGEIVVHDLSAPAPPMDETDGASVPAASAEGEVNTGAVDANRISQDEVNSLLEEARADREQSDALKQRLPQSEIDALLEAARRDEVGGVARPLAESLSAEDQASLQAPEATPENQEIAPEKRSDSVAEEPSMTRRAVKKIVARVASALPGLPKIVITRDNTEWPSELQDQFGGKSPRAAIHQGAIYIASNAFENPKEVQGAVLHEGVGHYGIRFVLGDAFDGFMDAVYEAHRDTALGRQIQATYKFDAENQADRNHFSEEVVAHLAENPRLDPTVWRRIVEAVKTGWRKVAGGNVSEDEIHRLVRKAYRKLQQGDRAESPAGARFSAMPQSAINVFHNDSEVLPKPPKKVKNASVAQRLADVAVAFWNGMITSSNITPEQEALITANGTDEVQAALKAEHRSAANWYSEAVEVAMAIAGIIHPELSSLEAAMKVPAFAKEKDPIAAAQLVMRAALAITSQNLAVSENTRYSDEQFSIFKGTGQFDPAKSYGEKARSISGNLALANEVFDEMGINDAEQFISKEFTVDGLEKAASKVLGRRVRVSGLREDIVNGAALFGPKIGQGFLQNLMGNFNPVTIDLWMRRTWGRWTGDVIGDGVTATRMARLIDAAREAGIKLPEFIKTVRTVDRLNKSGSTYRTVSEAVADQLEDDLELHKQVAAFAAEVNTRWGDYYRLLTKPITLELLQRLESTIPKLENGEFNTSPETQELRTRLFGEVLSEQRKITERLEKKWAALKPKPTGKGAKGAWMQAQHVAAGRTAELTNPLVGAIKPQWAHAAKAIISKLNPIDIPSNQDRKVISRIVNKIRVELEARGYTTTNADIQAILWFPEKDLWAKLRGEGRSNLNSSYDKEFLELAEKRGLGAEARAVADRVRADRAARAGRTDEARPDASVPSRADGATEPPRFSIPGERQHGEKLAATDKLDDPIKDRITNWLYGRRSNADDAAVAAEVVAHHGIAAAEAEFRDDRNGLPEAVRSMLGHAIVTAYGQLERRTRIDGNISQANEVADRAAAFINNDVLPRSTELAQGLQAFAAFALLTPAGWLASARRTVEGVRGNKLAKAAPAIGAALDAMQAVNRDVVAQVGASAAVQAEAAKALETSVVEAPEIEWVVRQAAAEEFGGLKELVADHFSGRNPGKTLTEKLMAVYGINAKEAGAKAKTIETQWKKGVERFKGQAKARARDERSLWQRYQQGIAAQVVSAVRARLRGPSRDPALVGFSDRVAALLRAHVERHMKATAGKPVASMSPASVIGEALKNPEKYQEAWLASVEALRTEYAGNPAVLQRLEDAIRERPDLIAVGPLNRAVSSKFRELRLKMGAVVRQHYLDQAAVGRQLSDRLVQDAGVQGAAALQLAAAVQAKFSQLASARKAAELQKLVKAGAAKVIVRKGVAQRIIELSNLGAFENRAAMEAVAERMGLPSLTDEAAREVTRMASDLQQLPKDSHMQKKATVELMNFLARQKGMNWWDLPLAFWYANTLSGPITHAINAGSNLLSVAGSMSSVIVRRPTNILGALSAAADGFRRGAPEALAVLKHGINMRSEVLEAQGTLEVLQDKDLKGLGVVLNKWRYVGRALAASDRLFYYGNREVRSALLARGLARREGLSGQALHARVREILGTSQEARAAAQAQASTEGVTGLDYARRVNEIMDRGRPAELAEDADQWALRATFNNKPYGLLGVVAEGLNLINRKTVVTRMVVPFVNVVANVTNEGLNYSPVGFGRGAWAHWNIHRGGSGTLFGQDVTSKESIYDAYAKAAVGTAMVAALVSLAARGLDDDDWWFGLSGQGPADASRRKALRETGWIPYSIRIGRRYINYANTPLAVPLAIGGNYLDAMRHGNLSQTDALNRVAFAVASVGHVITQQSFLDSIAQLFGSLDHINDKKAGDRLADVVARSLTTVFVPNALRQVDRMFDPRVMDPMTARERVVAQIPFVRRGLKPALNALGEPVRIAPLDRLVSGTREDDLWVTLARVGAAPSIPEQGLLTAEEHYDLVEYRAGLLRPKLEAALGKISSGTPAEARRLVSGLTSTATATAKRALGLDVIEKARASEQ